MHPRRFALSQKSLQLLLLSGLAVIGIYVALILGEFVGTTRPYLHLRNEMGVPVLLLRMCVLAVTVFPAAVILGRGLMLRSASSGRRALVGVGIGFTLIIGALQIFVYDWSVLGASLLKIAFAAAGLILVAYWPSLEH